MCMRGFMHLVERSADVTVVIDVHTTVQPQHRIPKENNHTIRIKLVSVSASFVRSLS